MRVVAAPDKFRGTLSAAQAAEAISAGWRRADPRAEIDEVPVADGGEGTLETLVAALGGRIERAKVTGPLGDPVEAEYGLAEDGRLAIVEMARASGLSLLGPTRRDPLRATTFGTGELMLAAAEHRPRTILVCIGGSATNDAGAGMAQALGVRLLDRDGGEVARGGVSLVGLARVDTTKLDPRIRDAEILVASDVDNPLTGPDGAAVTFGPQKGATPEDVAALDRALRRCASVVERDLGLDLSEVPGAGAAGGLGGGLVAFLGAKLRPGFELVSDLLQLPQRIEASDVVVTGEGRFDRQSLHGKAPAGVLRLAQEAGTRSVLIAGQIEEGLEVPAEMSISLEETAGEACFTRPREALTDAAEQAARRLGRTVGRVG